MGQGFLFENMDEIALVDIDADNGNLRSLGVAHFQGIGDNYFNGSIGIGTTSPSASLSFSNTTGNKIDLYHTTLEGGDRYGIQVQNNELRIHSGAKGLDSGGITFGKHSTSSFTEHVRFTNEGNVGIGTTTPDAKLAVNGTIHTKEVKVDLSG